MNERRLNEPVRLMSRPERSGLLRRPKPKQRPYYRSQHAADCVSVQTTPYLNAGVAGLSLGLDVDVPPAVLLTVPVRVVARVAALVGDDGRDGLGRIRLDEESVQRGRGALGDGGGLVGGVGFVRVPTVDHPALRDVDAGCAAHASAKAPCGALSPVMNSDTRVPPSL